MINHEPRPYQTEALDALDTHMRAKDTHPCVVIPTGGGKSLLMAWAIQMWKLAYPPFRCCILAHRKELVEQNSSELLSIWPEADVGVYAAGLGRRDLDNAITFASIDSVHKRWGEFAPFDVLIIDEAHRIPASGEGKYRAFIKGCESLNDQLRVIGFTATPYRMGCGPICHRDHILNEICYEANVSSLIAQGYLCKLRSKTGDVKPDLSGVKQRQGDYVAKSLAAAVDTPELVRTAIKSAMRIIQSEQRMSVMFFCIDVAHCRHVSLELSRHGIVAPQVTGKTPGAERDRIATEFKAGRYRAICNVNVYTEGFNAKRVDCIVDLAPTLSPGRFAQKVGRGLRTHPGKTDCLYLDYGRNIETHGPIDAMDGGEVRLAECQECGDTFSRAVRACPNCGWEIPKQEIEREEAEVAQRQMHEREASERAILGNAPEELTVTDVKVHRHKKPGKPDSIRVQYRCGVSSINEWICLDHGGYAEQKARAWWARRFLGIKHITVDEALESLFFTQRLNAITESITVMRRGKHIEIVDYKLKRINHDQLA